MKISIGILLFFFAISSIAEESHDKRQDMMLCFFATLLAFLAAFLL